MSEGQMKIEDTRFSQEDLFALLGGFDADMFCCHPKLTGPDDSKRIKKLEKWRLKLIRRYSKLGLVDTSGSPRDDLAQALEPLCQPTYTVSNAMEPDFWNNEEERRKAIVYLREDLTGTVVLRAAGLWGGFFLLPLETLQESLDAILGIHHIRQSFKPAPPAEHQIVWGDHEYTWQSGIFQDKPSDVLAAADRCEFDPARLFEVSRWWQSDGMRAHDSHQGMEMVRGLSHVDSAIGGAMFDRMTTNNRLMLPVICEYETRDYHGITFSGTAEDGIAYRQVNLERDGTFRHKTTLAFPAVGFSVATQHAPRAYDPPYWDTKELAEHVIFGCYDFFETADDLARSVLEIDENPNP